MFKKDSSRLVNVLNVLHNKLIIQSQQIFEDSQEFFLFEIVQLGWNGALHSIIATNSIALFRRL